MKFLTLIAAVSAVRISQKSKAHVSTKGPRQEAEKAIEDCDASGNGELTKKEAIDCIMNEHDIPAEHRPHVRDFINQIWPMVDTSGNGQVSADEIEAFIRQMNGSLAQMKRGSGGPSPQEAAAAVIDHCDGDDQNGKLSKHEFFQCIKDHIPQEHREEAKDMIEQVWPMIDTDGDGEVDEHELAAAMRNGPPSLAQRRGGPSPSDIIDACDENGSGGISLEEAHACIDAHITDPEENKQAHEMVDAGFDHVDKNGDGEIDEHELSKAMRAHRDGNKLIQMAQGPTTPAEVMNECDTSGNNKISKEEAIVCIKAHAPPEYEEHIEEMVNHIWPMVDTDGSGEVDMDELRAAMSH